MQDIKKLKEQLVLGCHVLGGEEWVKSMGHLSVRIPDSDLFLMSRDMSVHHVKEEDIWTFNLKGEKVEGGNGTRAGEMPIHYCIYRARPDVNSVCHLHPPNATLLTLIGETIKPLLVQGTNKFPRGVPVCQKLGLIVTDKLGDATAEALGDSNGVLIRAHGAASVGKDIKECVMNMLSIEEMASFQVRALAIGKPLYLKPEELIEIKETFRITADVSSGKNGTKKMWNYLVSKIEK